MVKVAASLLAADFTNLSNQILQIESAGVDLLHFDVMDGHFVPNITMGPVILRAVSEITKLPLDVHLMIEDPEKCLQAFIDAGANSVTVHVEACNHLHRVIQQIKANGVKACVAINPATPVAEIEPILPFVDMVLVMSVNPGFGGQKFIPEVLNKVRAIKSLKSDMVVEIDGGVNNETIEQIITAGVDIVVSGSYLLKGGDLKEKVRLLKG